MAIYRNGYLCSNYLQTPEGWGTERGNAHCRVGMTTIDTRKPTVMSGHWPVQGRWHPFAPTPFSIFPRMSLPPVEGERGTEARRMSSQECEGRSKKHRNFRSSDTAPAELRSDGCEGRSYLPFSPAQPYTGRIHGHATSSGHRLLSITNNERRVQYLMIYTSYWLPHPP
jgi:hypothetical protein